MPRLANYYDYRPRAVDIECEVIEGLRRSPPALPPKLFYDQRGGELFEAITRTPEYYLTRAENEILSRHAAAIAERLTPRACVIEPGAGACVKIRRLLEALRPAVYIAVDLCGDRLREAADALAGDHPWLHVRAVCADFCAHPIPPVLPPGGPRVAFFPGSSIGNFEPAHAVAFIAHLAGMVGEGGFILIGVDRKKARERLDAAYNDAAGITAEFNKNVLVRINRELGADFDVERGFRHLACYNEAQGRVEMYLVSTRLQRVRIGAHRFRFEAGDSLHTENSYKYADVEFQHLARLAGCAPSGLWTDTEGLFAVHLFSVPGLAHR